MKTLPRCSLLSRGKMVKFCFGFEICFLRFVGIIKIAKMYFSSVYDDSGAKFIFTRPPLNAKYPGPVVFVRPTLVVKVFTHRGFTKVGDSVVCRVAVYMVDQFLRKFAIHIKPRKAMGLIPSIPNDYMTPSFATTGSGYISGLCSSAGNAPRKYPCFLVVAKKLTQTIGGQFFFYNSFSHDDSNKVGSVRACVAVQTPHRLVQFTGVHL